MQYVLIFPYIACSPFRFSFDRSLSPECTPLKHRYDTCFNLWFEGYLQPALDNARPVIYPPSIPSTASASASPSISSPDQHQDVPQSETQEIGRKPLITSWSNVFPTSHRQSTDVDQTHRRHLLPIPNAGGPEVAEYSGPVSDAVYVDEVDKKGKTRVQVKAEEYDRACGQVWRDYQGCLKRAIRKNENLSTLLEQAREEHPLKSMEKLAGTAWDPKTNPADIGTNDI
nr:hypothetical protein L203_03140 [Cryptococcus depauperatus CBS 7841]